MIYCGRTHCLHHTHLSIVLVGRFSSTHFRSSSWGGEYEGEKLKDARIISEATGHWDEGVGKVTSTQDLHTTLHTTHTYTRTHALCHYFTESHYSHSYLRMYIRTYIHARIVWFVCTNVQYVYTVVYIHS